MICSDCGKVEMEEIPSVIEVDGVSLGDPNVKFLKCPVCKHIYVKR